MLFIIYYYFQNFKNKLVMCLKTTGMVGTATVRIEVSANLDFADRLGNVKIKWEGDTETGRTTSIVPATQEAV